MTNTLDKQALPESAAAQLEALAKLLHQSLGESLLGLILHGSATTAGFEVERSDLDVLAIIDGPLTPAQREAIGKGILLISNAPHPIEISVIAKQDLDSWSHPCRHELHYGEDSREQFSSGKFESAVTSDADLAIHITLARARGVDLLGTYPAAQLPTIPRRDYLSAILSDFEWAASQEADLGDYAIANACRTLAFLQGGAILSKSEGIEWCRENGIDTTGVIEEVTSKLHISNRGHS